MAASPSLRHGDFAEFRRQAEASLALRQSGNIVYATTLFDYIRRAMPWTAPRSLTDDQVYALTAYILAQNKLIDAKDGHQRPNATERANAQPQRLHSAIS